jgi:colanic acid biosynthesis glycosyl transferase WcaI
VTIKPGFARLVSPSKLAGVLAAGRPVLFVGPPDGEIAQLLAQAPCGVTVGPRDGEGLADTIAAWQADEAQRARLGRNARAVYERNFTFATALARWDDILRQTASGP